MKDLVTPSPTGNRPDGKIVGLRIVGALAAIAGLAGFGMLVWAAVSAAMGLVVLAAIALGGIAFFQALPLIGQAWENKLLAARKSVARRNPIEQLENFLLQKTEQVDTFRKTMTTIGGQLRTMRDLLAERKRTKPDYDPTRLRASIDQMQTFYDARKHKLHAAQAALAQVAELVEEKKFEWTFATMGQAAMETLNATDGKALLDNILAGEALNSVRDNFNKVFADLEIEAQSIPVNMPDLGIPALEDLSPATLAKGGDTPSTARKSPTRKSRT